MAEITDYVNVSNLIDALVDAREGSGIILPGGEANDGENIGTSGVGWYAGKDGVTLQFYNIDKGSDKVKATFNATTKALEIDVDEKYIEHQELEGHGVADHAELDGHLARTDNPHRTAPGNLQPGTLAELNGAISDATLDDKADPRPPIAHAASHLIAGSDSFNVDNIRGKEIELESPLDKQLLVYNDTTGLWEFGYAPRGSAHTHITSTPYMLGLDDGPFVHSQVPGAGISSLVLPDPSTTPEDGKAYDYRLFNFGPSTVEITIAGDIPFSDGLTKYYLRPHETLSLVRLHTDTEAHWSRCLTHIQHMQVTRDSTWDAVNWAGPPAVPIPFERMPRNDNDAIFDWDIATPAEITIVHGGLYKVSYNLDFNTTANSGSTQFLSEALINGVLVPGSRRILNFDAKIAEDPVIAQTPVPFDSPDSGTLEIAIYNTGAYSGNLRSAEVSIESEV